MHTHISVCTVMAQISHSDKDVLNKVRAMKEGNGRGKMSTVEVALNRFQHCPDWQKGSLCSATAHVHRNAHAALALCIHARACVLTVTVLHRQRHANKVQRAGTQLPAGTQGCGLCTCLHPCSWLSVKEILNLYGRSCPIELGFWVVQLLYY